MGRFAQAIALIAVVVFGALDPAVVQAQPPVTAPAKPVAPIETIFQRWLTTFNSGDKVSIKAFYKKYIDDDDPQFALETAQDTCGLTVASVEHRSAVAMTATLRERCLPGREHLKIELANQNSDKLKTLDITPVVLPGDGSIAVTAKIAGRLAARNDFAGSIIIARRGQKLLARSWGLADPAKRSPMTLDTPMFLASAGKMFTAVAVLQLVDAGRIDLDAPLGQYLTDYPNEDMAKVTIRQLLAHRGGGGGYRHPRPQGRSQSRSGSNNRRYRKTERRPGSRFPARQQGRLFQLRIHPPRRGDRKGHRW